MFPSSNRCYWVLSLSLCLYFMLSAGKVAVAQNGHAAALQVAAEMTGSETVQLAIVKAGKASFTYSAKAVNTFKVDDKKTGRLLKLSIDDDGVVCDEEDLVAAEIAAYTSRFGRMDPELAQTVAVPIPEAQGIPVIIWLNQPAYQRPARPDPKKADAFASEAAGLPCIVSMQFSSPMLTPTTWAACWLRMENRLFPQASYYICKAEWDFWFSEDARKRTPEVFVMIARQNLEPARSRVKMVEGEIEILPSIRVYPAPGHTPGHMVVEAVSGADHDGRNHRLFVTADTALYPLHLQHPGWLPVDEILPKQAAASKQAIFDRVAAQKTRVVAQHFPSFPSLGYVIKETARRSPAGAPVPRPRSGARPGAGSPRP